MGSRHYIDEYLGDKGKESGVIPSLEVERDILLHQIGVDPGSVSEMWSRMLAFVSYKNGIGQYDVGKYRVLVLMAGCEIRRISHDADEWVVKERLLPGYICRYIYDTVIERVEKALSYNKKEGALCFHS